MSDSVRPQRRQPTRLPRPWDSPGKNTGVGCHFLLQCMEVKSESEVAQSCLTLSDPMDCSPPGSSIHGIFQARVLEWGAIAFSGAPNSPCLLVPDKPLNSQGNFVQVLLRLGPDDLPDRVQVDKHGVYEAPPVEGGSSSPLPFISFLFPPIT